MALLRWDRDFALQQTAEDDELLAELIDLFKSSFASDIERIKEGIAAGNAKQIGAAAHSIKGAASSLGFTGVTDLVKEIEDDSKAGQVNLAQQYISELELMLAEVRSL